MLANLKFSHLNLLWSHVAQLIKRLNSNCFSIMFIDSLKYRTKYYFNLLLTTTNQYLEHCSSSSLAKHTCCAPDIVCRTPQERHFPIELTLFLSVVTGSATGAFSLSLAGQVSIYHSLGFEVSCEERETAADGLSEVIHSWRNR